MITKTTFVTALLSVGLQLAAAQEEQQLTLLPALCLSKFPPVGQPAEDATLFDQTAYLSENIQQDAYLYQYNVCKTEDNRLASIQLTYMDEDREMEQELKRAGPQDSTACITETFEQKGAISKVRIYEDGSTVTGMALGYVEGLIVQKMGKGSAQYRDYQMTDEQRLVGFYGANTETDISQLGLIVQNSSCTSKANVEAARNRRAQQIIADDEDNTMMEKFSWYVVLAWAGLIIVTILIFCTIATCIRCCCSRQSSHSECSPSSKKAQEIQMKEGQLPDERLDTGAPMNHYMQTEGPDAENPEAAQQEQLQMDDMQDEQDEQDEVQAEVQNEEDAVPPVDEEAAPAQDAAEDAVEREAENEEAQAEGEAEKPVEADNEVQLDEEQANEE